MDIIKAEKLVCTNEYGNGECRSLDEVSFSVSRGELICVLGAAGAGKTSLVRALIGLLPLCGGDLYVSGMDCRSVDKHWDIRKICGVVFENAEDRYISNSVHTELGFAAGNFGKEIAEIEKNAAEALTLVGLEGYENRSVPLMTAFERYRLAIAAILVYEPEIILIDSMAESFDDQQRGTILDIVNALHKSGKTVIYTTRNSQDAVSADRVMVLKDGRLLDCERPDKIITNVDLLKEAGLELPFTVRVYHDLLDAGVKLERCPLDIDELVEEICK